MFDVWLMFLFGIIGIVIRNNDYSLIPLILGIILGPIIEGSFIRSMLVSSNNPLYFFGITIAIKLWVLTVLALFVQPISSVVRGLLANWTYIIE